jgi:hypothetical protein
VRTEVIEVRTGGSEAVHDLTGDCRRFVESRRRVYSGELSLCSDLHIAFVLLFLSAPMRINTKIPLPSVCDCVKNSL